MFIIKHRLYAAFLLLNAIVWLPAVANGDLVYAVTGGHQGTAAPSVLYTVDTTTGKATPIGPTGVSHLTGLAIDPTTGVLYGHQNYPSGPIGTGTLHTINLATGVAQRVGETVAAINDISFDSSGQLYGWLNDSSRPDATELSDNLVTLNKDTGAFSLVFSGGGETDIPANQSGLTFTPDDTLYLKSGEIDRTGKDEAGKDYVGMLHEIDIQEVTSNEGMPNEVTSNVLAYSSVETDQSPISTLAAFSNELAFTVVRGKHDDGTVGSALATLNLDDGMMEVGNLITEGGIEGTGGWLVITALAVPVSVPEPTAVLLLVVASARLLSRRRR